MKLEHLNAANEIKRNIDLLDSRTANIKEALMLIETAQGFSATLRTEWVREMSIVEKLRVGYGGVAKKDVPPLYNALEIILPDEAVKQALQIALANTEGQKRILIKEIVGLGFEL